MDAREKRVTRYLSKELSYLEEQAILQDMEKDASLRDEFEYQEAVRSYILGRIDYEEASSELDIDRLSLELASRTSDVDPGQMEEIRQFIKKSLNDTSNSLLREENAGLHKSTISRKLIPWLAFAASAVIALIVVFKASFGDLSGENLYHKYYTHFDPLDYTFRGTSESELSFQKGIQAYKKNEYKNAAQQFISVKEDNSFHEDALFYLGLCYMEMESYDEAILTFIQYQAGYREYIRETNWYLGLCYCETGELERAGSLFNILASQKDKYGHLARKALRRIDLNE